MYARQTFVLHTFHDQLKPAPTIPTLISLPSIIYNPCHTKRCCLYCSGGKGDRVDVGGAAYRTFWNDVYFIQGFLSQCF